MDNTITALKALYVALGGTAADVANITIIPEMIKAIATQAETVVEAANATELPKVTGSDNGKILTVSSGKWTKAAAPTELPAVTADDNGKVLKVANGAWGVGTDATE